MATLLATATPQDLPTVVCDAELVRDRWHRYKFPGDTTHRPSVTTCINKLSKGDSLLYWAAGCSADYVTRLVEEIYGAPEELAQEIAARNLELLRDWKTIRDQFATTRDAKADKGTAFHNLIARYSKGQAVNFDLFPDDVRDLCRNAWKWMDDFGYQPRLVEFPCVSHTFGYAGTADSCGWLDLGKGPELWSVDFKTGDSIYEPREKKRAIYPIEHALQLAALANCDQWFDTQRMAFRPMPAIARRGVLHVKPSGCTLWEWPGDTDAFTAFLSMLHVYHFEKKTTQPIRVTP